MDEETHTGSDAVERGKDAALAEEELSAAVRVQSTLIEAGAMVSPKTGAIVLPQQRQRISNPEGQSLTDHMRRYLTLARREQLTVAWFDDALANPGGRSFDRLIERTDGKAEENVVVTHQVKRYGFSPPELEGDDG